MFTAHGNKQVWIGLPSNFMCAYVHDRDLENNVKSYLSKLKINLLSERQKVITLFVVVHRNLASSLLYYF
jgi:hypothetical protein